MKRTACLDERTLHGLLAQMAGNAPAAGGCTSALSCVTQKHVPGRGVHACEGADGGAHAALWSISDTWQIPGLISPDVGSRPPGHEHSFICMCSRLARLLWSSCENPAGNAGSEKAGVASACRCMISLPGHSLSTTKFCPGAATSSLSAMQPCRKHQRRKVTSPGQKQHRSCKGACLAAHSWALRLHDCHHAGQLRRDKHMVVLISACWAGWKRKSRPGAVGAARTSLQQPSTLRQPSGNCKRASQCLAKPFSPCATGVPSPVRPDHNQSVLWPQSCWRWHAAAGDGCSSIVESSASGSPGERRDQQAARMAL